MPGPTSCRAKLHEVVPKVLMARTKQLQIWLGASQRKLGRPINDIDEYVELMQDMKHIYSVFNQHHQVSMTASALLNVVEKNNMKLEFSDRRTVATVVNEVQELRHTLSDLEAKVPQRNDKFIKELKLLIPDLQRQVVEAGDSARGREFLTLVTSRGTYAGSDAAPFSLMSSSGSFSFSYLNDGIESGDISSKLDKLNVFLAKVDSLKAVCQKYEAYEKTLGTEVTSWHRLDEVHTELWHRKELWLCLQEWTELSQTWLSTQFLALDTTQISQEAEKRMSAARRAGNRLPPNPVVGELVSRVNAFEKAVPIVDALKNPNMTARHWSSIQQILVTHVSLADEQVSLLQLLELNVVQFNDMIIFCSHRASQELKKKLKNNKYYYISGT